MRLIIVSRETPAMSGLYAGAGTNAADDDACADAWARGELTPPPPTVIDLRGKVSVWDIVATSFASSKPPPIQTKMYMDPTGLNARINEQDLALAKRAYLRGLGDGRSRETWRGAGGPPIPSYSNCGYVGLCNLIGAGRLASLETPILRGPPRASRRRRRRGASRS
jgi:hypothetical protein